MTKEVTVPAHVLERLGAALAQDDDPSLWAGLNMEFLRPHIARLAPTVLTEREWEILSLRLAGYKEQAIANRLSIAQPTVHQTIWGKQGRAGAARKLSAALETDPDFCAALAQAREQAGVDDDVTVLVRNWYRPLPAGNAQLLLPFAVLMVLYFLRDAKNRVRHQDATQHLPRAAITHALSLLRPLGYIETDGITMTIKKTPHGPLQGAA